MQSHVATLSPPSKAKKNPLTLIINKSSVMMMKIGSPFSCSKAIVVLLIIIVISGGISCCSASASASAGGFDEQVVVKREERRCLASSEYGEISAARLVDQTINASYLVHFFTLDPNSLFLPVILHAHMLFYVHTGSGKLRWREGDEVKNTDLRRGDIHRLEAGALFLIQSNLDTDSDRQKLRIHAIFPNSDKFTQETGPYSSIRDMILGFDNKVLQAAFKVPAEKIEELVNGTKPPAIIHALSATNKNTALEMEARFIEKVFGATTSTSYNIFEINKKKKSKKEKDKEGSKAFNFFKADKDFSNCNGWSTAVTSKKMAALTGTDIGLFMVNLTEGSMMGPHWNPTATEIAVVLQGRGMVRVVCTGNSNVTGCNNMRYEVEEGDTFVVPRFHAMAQMAFNNDTFVFMGFSTSAHTNHPQYLAGQASVLRTLEKEVLAVAFNVTDTTMDQLLSSQKDSVILGCISCAEEELKIVEEEMEKEREAERERAAEEARKREEERQKEAREREEEEAREREEKEAAREAEEAARQEEERERREEEEERKSEEEEARRRQEEEERKRQEEEERKREEEAARKAAEEERKREEEEATRRAAEEEEAREREEAARRAEEEERKREEDEERKREEEAARRAAEEQAKEREEEAARRAEEEEREREEEQAKEREEEAARRAEEEEREREEEQAKEREEEAARREEEEERERREDEEREKEEETRRAEEEEEEDEWSRKKEEGGGKSEQEQAEEDERRRQEEARREEEEEEEPPSTKAKETLFHLFPNSLGRFRVY